jgi:hypothetical protein
MKKLMIGTAFVAMLATPALAQSFDPDSGTGNVNPALNSIYGGQRYDAEGLTSPRHLSAGGGPYAYEPAPSARGRHSYSQREESDFPVYQPND